MDDRRLRLLQAAALLGIVAVFGVLIEWRFDVVGPAIESNLLLFQLILAATVVAIFRTEVGVSTFGVFAPTIIAFAWIEAGPLWGLLLVSYLFFLAVATRLALGQFGLSTPHRVAVILTVVALGLLLLDSVSVAQPSLPQFATGMLFPAIITAWYGERFVNMAGDDGWPSASRRLAWTVVVVGISYLVVSAEPFVRWFATTPISWAALVGLHLYLGYTTTFRLSEYFRFGVLQRSLYGGGDATQVLSLRVRNREFISRYNPGYLLANLNKLVQKRVFHGTDVPTPETYLLLDDASDLEALDDLLAERDEFALKPASSLGGQGILVVTGRTDDGFETSRGAMTAAEIRSHAADVLAGRYERGYTTEREGYVEALVRPRGDLYQYCQIGVPDLRVIVLRGIPVMAMVRLPTRESHGAANLHGGAVGVSVDIADGVTGGAYQQTHDRWLDTHPDTGTLLEFEIANWSSVLELASTAATASHLGYTGVDIVFDESRGPLVLEVNRRPGLGIQNVNLDGLLRRLRVAEGAADDLSLRSPSVRVQAAMAWDEDDWDVDTTDWDVGAPDGDVADQEVDR